MRLLVLTCKDSAEHTKCTVASVGLRRSNLWKEEQKRNDLSAYLFLSELNFLTSKTSVFAWIPEILVGWEAGSEHVQANDVEVGKQCQTPATSSKCSCASTLSPQRKQRQ